MSDDKDDVQASTQQPIVPKFPNDRIELTDFPVLPIFPSDRIEKGEKPGNLNKSK